ncbi:MAG: 5'(3')-deoxyribonucleotidase [Bacteroidota bacterium]
MQRIAIDMDEVLGDVYGKLLMYFERDLGWRPKWEEYAGRKLYELEGATHLRDYIHARGFFSDIRVMPDSQAVVQELMESYEVFIVTATMEFRYSMEDKLHWLSIHFPFIPWKNIVMCGTKSIVKADYMIDDHIWNLDGFDGKGLLYTASHNIHNTTYSRVDNWLAVRDFFNNVK